MKNKRSLLAAMAVVLFLMAGCSNAMPVVDVITQDEKGKYHYDTVLTSGKTVARDRFECDNAEWYEVDCLTLDHEITSGNFHHIISEHAVILDADGKDVSEDTRLKTVLKKVCDVVDHDIMEFRILTIRDETYAFVKLNVNWSDPCDLYQIGNEAVRLTGWQDRDLIGLHLCKTETE